MKKLYFRLRKKVNLYYAIVTIYRSDIFDHRFYQNAYPDVGGGKINRIRHYILHGAAERRDPSPYFSTKFYLGEYDDVYQAGVNPLFHYITKGYREDRKTNRWFVLEQFRGRGQEKPDAQTLRACTNPKPGFSFDSKTDAMSRERFKWKANGNEIRSAKKSNTIFEFFDSSTVNEKYSKFQSKEYLLDFHRVDINSNDSGNQIFRNFLDKDQVAQPDWKVGNIGFFSETNTAEYGDGSHDSDHLDYVRKLAVVILGEANFSIKTEPAASSLEELRKVTSEIIVLRRRVSDKSNGSVVWRYDPPAGAPAEDLSYADALNKILTVLESRYVVVVQGAVSLLPGWSADVIRTFKLWGGTAAIGGKTLLKTGHIVEFGGTIGKDRLPRFHGAWDDAAASRYGYAQEVHFVSGSIVAFDIAALRSIGGFDSGFRTKLWADIDVAKRLRGAGYRVLVQPSCCAIAREETGALHQSLGDEFLMDSKRYCTADHPAAFAEHAPFYRGGVLDRPMAQSKQRVLFVDQDTPEVLQDDQDNALYRLMRGFVDVGLDVTFLAATFYRNQDFALFLERAGIEVISAPEYSNIEQFVDNYHATFELVILVGQSSCLGFQEYLAHHYASAKFGFLIDTQQVPWSSVLSMVPPPSVTYAPSAADCAAVARCVEISDFALIFGDAMPELERLVRPEKLKRCVSDAMSIQDSVRWVLDRVEVETSIN
jgi:hypothetical protein